MPFAERRARLRVGAGRRPGAGLRHRHHPGRRHRPALVRHVRGRGPRRRRRQDRGPAVRAGPAADDEGQARPHRGLRGGRVPLAQERADRRARCCSASTTTRAKLQHIGVAASFPMARRAELVEELAPYRAEALDGHPWQDWANAAGAGERREPDARARSAGGTRRRTCRGCRCGPSSSWRSSTTSSRAVDFVTPASSSAGGPTASRRAARTTSWTCPVRYDLAEVLAG